MLVLNLLAFENKKCAAYDHFHGNGLYGEIPTKKLDQSECSDLPCHIITEHIFARNGGYCVIYSPNILCNNNGFENWEYHIDNSFSWGIPSHMTRLDHLCVN